MEIEYKGATGVIIKSGASSVMFDPRLSEVGLKDLKVDGAIEVVTEPRFIVNGNEKLLISGPGEYEVAEVSVKGVAASHHLVDASRKTTVYRVQAAGFRIAFVGHVSEGLSDDQLEALGIIDILILPVGGGGYTLNAHEATKVLRQIDPKVVIPVHYADKTLKYEVPQDEVDLFVKELGATLHESVAKYKLKAGAALPEVLTLVELQRS